MCTCEEIEEEAHAHGASKLNSGTRMVNWEAQSKTLPESGRWTHLLYCAYLYCILLRELTSF